MQRGNKQNNFSGMKNCVLSTLIHTFGRDDEDCDHPSSLTFLYDFGTDAVYLYCAVCEMAWIDEDDFKNNINEIHKSSFVDFSKCIPANLEQIKNFKLDYLVAQERG
jgi:hypothetical protein